MRGWEGHGGRGGGGRGTEAGGGARGWEKYGVGVEEGGSVLG